MSSLLSSLYVLCFLQKKKKMIFSLGCSRFIDFVELDSLILTKWLRCCKITSSTLKTLSRGMMKKCLVRRQAARVWSLRTFSRNARVEVAQHLFARRAGQVWPPHPVLQTTLRRTGIAHAGRYGAKLFVLVTRAVAILVFYQNPFIRLRQSQAIAKKNNTEQCVLIMDLSGWGLRNRDNATLNMQIDHLQNNYPESLGACFLCNYPWLLWPVWKVAKMWLDPKTASKVVFVEKGNNDILTSLVSPDVLPTGVGGTCAPSRLVWATCARACVFTLCRRQVRGATAAARDLSAARQKRLVRRIVWRRQQR